LSPYDKADEDRYYAKALSWALINNEKHNIKNIALTGTYGSGKSSILVTFIKNNTNADLHFLNISLATFKEEQDEQELTAQESPRDISNENNQTCKKEDKLRLIELSILQQIFYHEKDRKLPDSRLKRIKSYSLKRLIFDVILSIIVILSIVYKFYPKIFCKFINIDFPKMTNDVLFWVSSGVIIIAAFFLLKNAYRTFKNIRLSKLNITNSAEIVIDNDISKSILNHHFDELLYFFEVTNYNVVVFEDLDRFKETEVFTKLREINLLLNNSKKIKRSIIFIYAIRDDMFSDNERTKFFDFIIPVISVINSSNSSEILSREMKKILNLSDISGSLSELIEDISYFIRDMRLLYNILNEYIIYKNILNSNLDQSKLLAIIFYKNLFPNDFVALCNNEGKLAEIFEKKPNLIKKQVDQIDSEISENRQCLNDSNAEHLSTMNELMALYIFKYISEIKNGINAFYINSKRYEISDVINEDIFSYFISDNVKYYHYTNGNYRMNEQTASLSSFDSIQKAVDQNYTFEQRKKNIENKSKEKTDELRNKIAELELKKRNIRKKTLKELYQSDVIGSELLNRQEGKIIDILLRNGYIDENYNDYVSMFYEGSLTKIDNDFLVNVKNKTKTDFDYRLVKIENLINKININDFENEYVLNYNIMDFLLSTTGYDEQKKAIFSLFAKEVPTALKFIDGFIEYGANVNTFIKELCHAWKDYWKYVCKNVDYDDIKRKKLLKFILESADLENIKNMRDSLLVSAIESIDDPNSICSEITKLKTVIKELDIKFSQLDSGGFSDDLFEFIYKNNNYEISVKSIKMILKYHNELNQLDFDMKNYYAIRNSNCDELIKYIEFNISQYLQNVYLGIEGNNAEPEETLLLLLNNDGVGISTKEKIINTVKTQLSDLTRIKKLEIKRLIIKGAKVKPLWVTLLSYYHEEEDTITDVLISYMNVSDNVSMLSKIVINEEIIQIANIEENVLLKFIGDIILENQITDENYSVLVKSIPCCYDTDELDFCKLSESKILILINNKKIGYSHSNYVFIKDNFSKLNVLFLERYENDFMEDISSFAIQLDELAHILKSNKLSLSNKNIIVNTINEADIISNEEILVVIGECILASDIFDVNLEILKNIIIKTNLELISKLKIFICKMNKFEKVMITEILLSLKAPYSEITINGKHPLLESTDINRMLVENLLKIKYISSCSIEDNMLRVNTFKKQEDDT
jgi:hypothetical protein